MGKFARDWAAASNREKGALIIMHTIAAGLFGALVHFLFFSRTVRKVIAEEAQDAVTRGYRAALEHQRRGLIVEPSPPELRVVRGRDV